MAQLRQDIFGLGFAAGSKEYRHSVFEELIYDSIHLAYMAHDQAKREDADDYVGDLHSAMLARASIISSMLTLEAAANCCLDVLPWPRALRDDIDKLPALSKLELFLKHHDSTKVLDRGSKVVQQVEDLKGLRDRVVHPKVRRAEWTPVNDTTQRVDLGESKVLALPFDTSSWGPGDAREALRAVTEFFSYFFIDLCGLTSNQTCEILVGSGPIDLEHPTSYHMDSVDELKRAAVEWNLAFRFFGVHPRS
jgi:hypothetical protein